MNKILREKGRRKDHFYQGNSMGSGKEVRKCAVCFGKGKVLWLEPRMFVGEVTEVEIEVR